MNLLCIYAFIQKSQQQQESGSFFVVSDGATHKQIYNTMFPLSAYSTGRKPDK